jgi:hypothetical protein
MTTSVQNDSSGLVSLSQIKASITPIQAPALNGLWATIDYQPDLFVPQSFTIGVVAQAFNDRLQFHLLDDFKKFECVYGRRLSAAAIRMQLTQAEATLREAAQARIELSALSFDTPHVRISAPVFSANDSFETAVERLFSEVVVMAPHEVPTVRDFEPLDTPKVRAIVNQEIKRIAGPRFEEIVLDQSNSGVWVTDNTGENHFLDFNLRTRLACGSVVSGMYKTLSTSELNLLKASRDLATFASMHPLIKDRAIFMLQPDASCLTSDEYRRMNETLDEDAWKLAQDAFRVVRMDSVAPLAREVFDWALSTI